MLQFSLGLVTGVMMGVFIMCLMIMSGRGQEPRREETWDEEPVRPPVPGRWSTTTRRFLQGPR